MKISITTPYIKLDQLLKYANVVESGGIAKECILSRKVLVNGEVELRRGRKIYKGYVVTFENEEITVD